MVADNTVRRSRITYFPSMEFRVEITLGISRKSALPPLRGDQLGVLWCAVRRLQEGCSRNGSPGKAS